MKNIMISKVMLASSRNVNDEPTTSVAILNPLSENKTIKERL